MKYTSYCASCFYRPSFCPYTLFFPTHLTFHLLSIFFNHTSPCARSLTFWTSLRLLPGENHC